MVWRAFGTQDEIRNIGIEEGWCAQERLGRGEYNPATTRVLHFVHNPETEARREADTAQISQLQAEAAALRAELAVLKSGASASDPTAPATAVAAAEKTLLERKVCMQRFDQENIGLPSILCSADMAADLVQTPCMCAL